MVEIAYVVPLLLVHFRTSNGTHMGIRDANTILVQSKFDNGQRHHRRHRSLERREKLTEGIDPTVIDIYSPSKPIGLGWDYHTSSLRVINNYWQVLGFEDWY